MSETSLRTRSPGKPTIEHAGKPAGKPTGPPAEKPATLSAGSGAAPVLLSPSARHFARRFSGGLTPALANTITQAGGGRAWFLDQLYPAKIADPIGQTIDGWFPSLQQTPKEIFDGGVPWEVMADLSRWTVARRIYSRRQLNELMVDFWSNLLHVPLYDDSAYYYRVSYDKMIRTYALTSFEQLLLHSTPHPAMGLFLDNAVSTKDAPNENLGRELLELHTVGVTAGYSEYDVKRSAKLLTGYRVDLWWPEFRSFYDPEVHYTGFLKIMGFTSANTAKDGRPATQAYLKYLAHHPGNARRLARRLCVKFVSDNPSAGLVNTVARAYLSHGTSIRPTLLAMVDHPEFAASALKKVRTPIEDYVATIRALGIQIVKPVDGNSFANAMYWQYSEMGQAPYEWPAPNGFPEDNRSWSTAGRLLNSFETHRDLTAQWWPTNQARFRSNDAWLPPLPATVDSVIDHAGRVLLGQAPGAAVKQGVAQVIGRTLNHRLTQDEADQYWTVIGIVSSLLDSPTHLHR
jgi:hypothetical protein